LTVAKQKDNYIKKKRAKNHGILPKA